MARDQQENNGKYCAIDPRFSKRSPIESAQAFRTLGPSTLGTVRSVKSCAPAEYFTVKPANFNGHNHSPALSIAAPPDQRTRTAQHRANVLWIEDFLIRAQVLSSDFIFAICRSKELRETPEEAQARLSARERRFAGYIDLFDAHTIAGWAADRTTPAAPISVDLFIDDRLQATLTADVFRQDLKDAGYGDGRKGFSLPLVFPTPFARGTQANCSSLIKAGAGYAPHARRDYRPWTRSLVPQTKSDGGASR